MSIHFTSFSGEKGIKTEPSAALSGTKSSVAYYAAKVIYLYSPVDKKERLQTPLQEHCTPLVFPF